MPPDDKKTQQIHAIGSTVEELRSKFSAMEDRTRMLEIENAQTVVYYKNIIDKIQDLSQDIKDFKAESATERSLIKGQIKELDQKVVDQGIDQGIANSWAKNLGKPILSAVIAAIVGCLMGLSIQRENNKSAVTIEPIIHQP